MKQRSLKRALSLCLAALLVGSLALCAGAAQKAPMDVVFLIDTSGSMEDSLDAAVELLRGYIDGLTGSGAADFRFALVDYRDFPGKTTYEEDYPYKVQADFTASVMNISLALGALDTGYGGDQEESVYSALIDGLSGLNWREGAGRVAVMVGDAAPLDPESETGYTAAAAAAAVQALGLTLHTVTILPAWEESPAPFPAFQVLAEAAQGQAVLLPEAAALLDTLLSYARALPVPPDPPEPYAPNLDLPASITIYRKDACDMFSAKDTANIRWESSNPSLLAIDNNGKITYQFAKTGTVTITAYEAESNDRLASVQVKVAWRWWQWILVVLLLGWIYL